MPTSNLIIILYSINNGLPFSNIEVIQYKVHESSRTQIVLFLSLSKNQVPQGESSNPSEWISLSQFEHKEKGSPEFSSWQHGHWFGECGADFKISLSLYSQEGQIADSSRK